MVRPVLLAVDDEPAARGSIEKELRKRYGADHEVIYAAQVTMLVRGPTLAETKRVAGAVGDGSVAIRLVHEYLSHQG